MNLIKPILFLILLLFSLEVYTQQKKCAALYTNQPYYFLGDTISAKVVVEEHCWPENHPLEITLIDPFGRMTIRQLLEPQGNPEFTIPLSGLTHEGLYRLALSFPKASHDLLLKHDLAILEESLPEADPLMKPEKLAVYSSGKPVRGIKQKLIIHTTGIGKQGVPAAGMINDGNGHEVVKFNTDGMGTAVVEITPDSGRYKVTIPGASLEQSLVSVESLGIGLNHTPIDGGFRFRVINKNLAGQYQLSITHQDGTRLERAISMNEQDSIITLEFAVPDFGFFKAELLDLRNNQALQEQWIYLPARRPGFSVGVTPNPQAPGEEVVVSIESDQKFPSFCSVLDLNQLPTRVYSLRQNPQWIQAYAEANPENLDRLISFMTLWSKNNYSRSDTIGEIAPDYGASIQGRLTDQNGLPQKYTPVILTIPSLEDGLYYAVTSSQGIFRFKGLVTDGNQSGYLYPMIPLVDSIDALQIEILLEDSLPSINGLLIKSLKHTLIDEIQRRLHNKMISNQFGIKAPATDLLSVATTEQLASIYGEPDHIFKLDEYVSFRNMREVIKEAVKDVNFIRRTNIRVYSHELQRNYEGKPLLLVDGIPTLSDSVILGMDPASIDRVEVITSRRKLMRLSSISQFGLVAFYTKQGVDINDMVGVEKIMIHGYDRPQPPQKRLSSNRDHRTPELHPAVYWDPDLKPGESFNLRLPHNYTHFAIHAGFYHNGSYFSSYQTLKTSWDKVP